MSAETRDLPDRGTHGSAHVPAERSPSATLLTAAGLDGIALTHVLRVADLGVGAPRAAFTFVALSFAALALSVLLMVTRAPARAVLCAAAVVAAVSLLLYVVSRSVGLPGDTGDVAHWLAPRGVLSVACAVVVTMGAVRGLRVRR